MSARIGLETAHQILATFGITEPSDTYDRRVKPDGFEPNDLHELVCEGDFVFIVDWRAELPEELGYIAHALSQLQVQLDVEEAEEFESCTVTCTGKSARVKYIPADQDDFAVVIATIQKLCPPTVEFRASPENGQSDTWEFAVLGRDEWQQLSSLAPGWVQEFFALLDR